jgi:alpha-galactosidase
MLYGAAVLEPIATAIDPANMRLRRAPDLARIDGPTLRGDVSVELERRPIGSGEELQVTLRATKASGPLGLVRLVVEASLELVLEHGWQSWSPVAVRPATTRRRLDAVGPRFARAMLHASPWLAATTLACDQFLLAARANDAIVLGALDARTCFWSFALLPGARRLQVVAVAWLDDLALGPGEELRLDPLWTAAGDPGRIYSEYVSHWAARAGARTPAPAELPVGWCSWYHYFWRVTPAAIRSNLAHAREHGFALVQIDDGYQRAVGDWLEPSRRFLHDPPPVLAEAITAAGLQAGIWTAPFLAASRSRLASDHPEWLLRSARGRPVVAMWNPASWGGRAFALDTSNPAVLDHLRTVFGRLREQGFSYHKIDFCYAAALSGRRHRPMTRPQALRAGIEAVREGIGEDAFLLGCGCPLGPAVGLVDAMRVSPDTAPALLPPRLARVAGEATTLPALANAVRASVLRAPMHRRLWRNDPDCALIRPVQTRLDANERRLSGDAVVGTGGFLVVSDDLATYRNKEWARLEELAAMRSSFDAPLDLDDPFAPVVRVLAPGGGTFEVAFAHDVPRSWALTAPPSRD